MLRVVARQQEGGEAGQARAAISEHREAVAMVMKTEINKYRIPEVNRSFKSVKSDRKLIW